MRCCLTDKQRKDVLLRHTFRREVLERKFLFRFILPCAMTLFSAWQHYEDRFGFDCSPYKCGLNKTLPPLCIIILPFQFLHADLAQRLSSWIAIFCNGTNKSKFSFEVVQFLLIHSEQRPLINHRFSKTTHQNIRSTPHYMSFLSHWTRCEILKTTHQAISSKHKKLHSTIPVLSITLRTMPALNLL